MNAALLDWAAARRSLIVRTAAHAVGIECGRGAHCSGILWNSQTVVTAAEPLQGADSVTVRMDSRDAVPAEILASDLSVDVAVLKVTSDAPDLLARTSSSLSAGDEVLIVGRGREVTLRWTQVEELGPAWRSRRGGELDRLIRLGHTLRRTHEGAGVFDLEGRLCAMAVRGPRHGTLGIPGETIERIVALVLRHGRLPQPYLGVRLQPVRLDATLRQVLARRSADAGIVVGVEPGSPAADAGLLFGDLIVSVAGEPVENGIDLKVALSRIAPGSSIGVQIFRAGGTLDATVTVRERGSA